MSRNFGNITVGDPVYVLVDNMFEQEIYVKKLTITKRITKKDGYLELNFNDEKYSIIISAHQPDLKEKIDFNDSQGRMYFLNPSQAERVCRIKYLGYLDWCNKMIEKFTYERDKFQKNYTTSQENFKN